MTKTKNAKTYLTPSVKVVSFKVEEGFQSPQPEVQGQNETMDRRGWNVDWGTSTSSND